MNERIGPCEEHRESLALMTSGDLPDRELAKAMRHFSECPGCRAHWAALQEDHRALQRFSRSHEERVIELERDVIASVLKERGGALEPTRWWRWIMATNVRRITAAAAAAALTVLLFTVIHMATAPFAAWAEVMENARNAESCELRIRNMDNQRVEVAQVFSRLGTSRSTFEKGELVEEMYVDFGARTALHLVPPVKRGVSMILGEEMVKTFQEKDPRHLFEHMSGVEHEDLGTRRIDGRMAVGMRARGRNLVPELMDEAELELWADPETKLPVRVDVHGESADGGMEKRVRFYDFKWNVPVAEGEFRPEPPAGYDVVSGLDLEMDEEHTIEALRAYARATDGRYPSTLAYEQVTPEMWKLMGTKVLSAEGLPLAHRMLAACNFNGKLVRENKEVVYFGDRVRPGESNRPLMRWKVGEDSYRVIFGDLRVDTVTGEALIELEGR